MSGAAAQLELVFAPRPRTRVERARAGEAMLERLRRLGLTGVERCRLTSNATVVASFRGAELRVHAGFEDAPDEVLEALVTFVNGRGESRRRARRLLVAYPLRQDAIAVRTARRERPHPDDAPAVDRLRGQHRALNARYFGGRLQEVDLRISRRMKRRLGHYRLPVGPGDRAEIVISRRHLRRHGWHEAVQTLLHEMVHQWQHESGLAVDHGRAFRRMARDVGIAPAATRASGAGPVGRLGAMLRACVGS